MPTKCKCNYCECDMEAYPSELEKNKHTFCCPDHYHKWISENKIRSGQNSNLWKNAKVEVVCKQCGKVNLIYKSQINWRGSSFCNKQCQAGWHSQNKSGKNSWNWIDKVKCKCRICGIEFERQRCDIKRGKGEYCSQKCKGISKKGSNNPNWNNGSSFGIYCYKFNPRRRKAVRTFFKKLCICCGKHVTENIVKGFGQIELSVHHVDHDKDQGCNGRPFNLIPMCNECHPKELHHQQEYKDYINKTLDEGFKWGIWSREQYEIEVMYPE